MKWAEEGNEGITILFKTGISVGGAIRELGGPSAFHLSLANRFQKGECESQWAAGVQYIGLGAERCGCVEGCHIRFDGNDKKDDRAQSGPIERQGLSACLRLRGDLDALDFNSQGGAQGSEKEKGKNKTHAFKIKKGRELKSTALLHFVCFRA